MAALAVPINSVEAIADSSEEEHMERSVVVSTVRPKVPFLGAIQSSGRHNVK